jgi:hypothetical protein
MSGQVFISLCLSREKGISNNVMPLLERDASSRSFLEEVFLFRQGTAAYPAPLLLQPGFDFLKAFV